MLEKKEAAVPCLLHAKELLLLLLLLKEERDAVGQRKIHKEKLALS